MLTLLIVVPMVSAQQHGHQQMMMPRVPADKLEEARALTNPLPQSLEIVEQGRAIYEGKAPVLTVMEKQDEGMGLVGPI